MTIKTALLVAIFVVGATLLATPAKAYFYQPAPYGYQYYNAYNPYAYGYQDTASQLIQSHINFVDNFRYIPSPVHYYFWQYYTPSPYYGGYGYGY